MNWGTGITVTLSLFVLFVLALVYGTSTAEFDLVAPDYYDQEIEYQTIIDAKQRGGQFMDSINLHIRKHAIELNIDGNTLARAQSWNIELSRPDNGALDRTLAIEPQMNHWKSSDVQLQSGVYLSRLSWELNDNLYVIESDLVVSD